MTDYIIGSVIVVMLLIFFAMVEHMRRKKEQEERELDVLLWNEKNQIDWRSMSTSGSTHPFAKTPEVIFGAPYITDEDMASIEVMDRTAHKCRYCGTKSLIHERNCISCGAPL
jgi:hypothetical protein